MSEWFILLDLVLLGVQFLLSDLFIVLIVPCKPCWAGQIVCARDNNESIKQLYTLNIQIITHSHEIYV